VSYSKSQDNQYIESHRNCSVNVTRSQLFPRGVHIELTLAIQSIV